MRADAHATGRSCSKPQCRSSRLVGSARRPKRSRGRPASASRTVFRHFPTKGHLLEAVFLAVSTRSPPRRVRCPHRTIRRCAGDILTATVSQAATKNALIEALAEAGVNVTKPGIGGDLRSVLAVLLPVLRTPAASGPTCAPTI